MGSESRAASRAGRGLHWVFVGLLIGNVLALVLTAACRPAAGWDMSEGGPEHARQATRVLYGGVVTLILACVLPWLRERRWEWWVVLVVGEALQIARLGLAVAATEHWPGGDDGPGMAWMMLLIPWLTLITLVGGGALMSVTSPRSSLGS